MCGCFISETHLQRRPAPLAVYCAQQEFAMALVPAFAPEQLEAMHCALKRASARMTGATPVIELIAMRILELARAGEVDADKMTDTVVAEFDL
jgi:hypothetical protein